MTMRVTPKVNVKGEAGADLVAGTTYIVSDAFGAALVGSGRAVDVDGVLNPKSGEPARLVTDPLTGKATGLLDPKDGSVIPFSSTQPLRIAATRGEIPTSTIASSSGKTRMSCRSRHRTGNQPLTTICAGWSQYYLSGARVETSAGNAATLQAHIEIPGAPTPVVVAKFSGASSVTLADGTSLQICDEISASSFGLTTIPANTDFYIVTEQTVATVGQLFLRSSNAEAASGEGGWFGDTIYTQIGVAGAVTVPSGGASTGTLNYPHCVLGRFTTPTPSVILAGSSLVTGQTDNAGFGIAGGGFYARGLWNVDGAGRAIPWVRQAVGGTSALQLSTNYTKQSDVWAYATHLICELGSNDGSGGQTAANTLTRYRTIYAAAKAKGIQRIEQQLCINRCPTSTDSWATAANMTPLTGFETGGAFKDPLNVLIKAEAAGSNGVVSALNVELDVSSQWADTTLADRVKGGYSTDGVHAGTVSAPLMAASVAARARSWTAT